MTYVRKHPAKHMQGLGELAGIHEPVAVVIRQDGSLDVYGHIAVIDQASSQGPAPDPRKQIGTVTVTRPRAYPLDPTALESPTTVYVPPGEYPVFLDGFTRYWRMTGMLNKQFTRLGDGAFSFGPDAPSDDDVVFYSRRYGPDEWSGLIREFAAEANPALVFTLDHQPQT